MKRLQVFSPQQVASGEAPLSDFNLQFLAQGDSWFSFGAIPPWNTSNLLFEMGTSNVAACAVNFASPGAELSVMARTTIAPEFIAYLNGNQQRRWSGLLLSGGGNDLIAAVKQPPTNPPNLRLLATSNEWIQALGAERYLSNAGWQTFCTHLMAVFSNLLDARDKGENKGMPIVMHSYDIVVPHNVGAGAGFGPWLYPAMRAFDIPEADWPAVAAVLMGRLQTLLDHIAANTADGSVHIVHTQGTLVPAKTTDTGPTADWQNEIHPTRHGYQKLGSVWAPLLDAVFT